MLPLSGVVTPFLSYGRTADAGQFPGDRHSALHLARGRRPTETHRAIPRARRSGRRDLSPSAGRMVLAKAAYVQVLHSAAIMGEGTLVVQADGARRYQYNPRFQEIMREIPKGSIYDRNGLPLATSNWDELEKHRAEYQQLGIDIDQRLPAHRKPPLSVRRPDVRPAGRSAHAHPLGRRQHLVRGARFRHAPARL